MADIQVYKRVIDYVGLNAKPIPERSLVLFRELNPVLALLQGMGADGAKLINVDANGNLGVGLTGAATVGARIQDGAGAQLATVGNTGDGVLPTAGLWTNAFQALYDGAGVSRAGRMASAVNLAVQSGLGATLSAPPGHWAVPSAPAAGVVASAVKAAGGAGVRHVCTGFSFMASAVVAPVLTPLAVVIRDGASGAGTVLASFNVAVPALTGQLIPPFGLAGLSLVGSANTAMTVEFSAALANLSESVLLTGYTAS